MVLYTGLGGVKEFVAHNGIHLAKMCFGDGSLMTTQEGLDYLNSYVVTEEDENKLKEQLTKFFKNETHKNTELE